jgi:uncharacterized cupredoxin-like copper-binding protein
VELRKGVNKIAVTFRNLKAGVPPVYLSNLLGESMGEVRKATDLATLAELNGVWDTTHSEEAGAVQLQAVPNQMQFSPKEFTVKAGTTVRLIFKNPDLMIHNFVLLKPGAEEEVGAQADRMAKQQDAAKRGYIPKSSKILQASGLVDPGGSDEFEFRAPKEPGRYPYICTFPGHWRLMRGVMIVE